MKIDKKRISHANKHGQIQVSLHAEGLKEAEINPWDEVNVVYEKDIIMIVKEENIGLLIKKEEKR